MNLRPNVIIVEDEVLIAKHIESALTKDYFNVIGIAHDSMTALDIIEARNPDLLILDINLGCEKDGIDVAEVINNNYDIPFIFLTALSDFSTLERAKKVRPCGFIIKPFKPRDLITSITIGLYNHEYSKSTKELTLRDVNKVALKKLSQKEFDVLVDISKGYTNAQIAKNQYISLSTVKFHSQNIYSKLDVNNRTSAVKKVLGL